jgi:glucose-6-phosphate 1-dehydrogenase
VQITAAEDLGIGSRAAYYDASGALRDLIQNHLLQLQLELQDRSQQLEAHEKQLQEQQRQKHQPVVSQCAKFKGLTTNEQK